MRTLRFIILLLSPFFLVGCPCGVYEKKVSDIFVENTSNDSVYVYLALGPQMNMTEYPDTVLPPLSFFKMEPWLKEYQEIWPRVFFECVEPLQPPVKRRFVGYIRGDESNLDSYLSRDTLSVFFIKKDSLDRYGYEDIRFSRRGVVRYDLSCEEVKRLRFSFPYPPQDFMEGMKIVGEI